MDFDNQYSEHNSIVSDFDNDDAISTSSIATDSSRKKRTNRMLDNLSNNTPGLICIRPANKRWNERRIDGYYSSVEPGAPIRNAVSGTYEIDYTGKTTYCVGSVWEDLFFKVVITTVKGSPYTLFYDSPEQYERHMNTSLSEDTTKGWYEKSRRASDYLNEVSENTKPRELTIIR